MAFCTKCGTQLAGGANFCGKCGTPVQAASQSLSVASGAVQSVAAAGNNTFTDPRDGRVYKTVKIGNQVWMAENLNYNAPGSKFYGNDPKNGEKYGRLYNLETAKKVCPPGWHLPNEEEWDVLINFVGGEEVAGKHLKAKSGWNDNGNGTDTYGFAALPGSHGYSDGDFSNQVEGYWLCDDSYGWCISESYTTIDKFKGDTGFYSVRCLQD